MNARDAHHVDVFVLLPFYIFYHSFYSLFSLQFPHVLNHFKIEAFTTQVAAAELLLEAFI